MDLLGTILISGRRSLVVIHYINPNSNDRDCLVGRLWYGRGVHILRATTQVWNCSTLSFLENLLRAKLSVNILLTSILGEKQHHTFPTPKRKTGEVNEVELRQRERPKCTVVLVLNLEYKTGAVEQH